MSIYGHVQLRGDPKAVPEDLRGIIHPIWPGYASGSPMKSWRMWLGRQRHGLLCLAYDPELDEQQKNGWIKTFFAPPFWPSTHT